uniref:Macro domain-containing protein n=2 Tax=Alexandrium monilatum TaxID=311494 RepID=A0A7S4Q8W7_9DINO|mmetsp:Transcript_100230/g.309221  ORF Transcript_100230/g.309221 Transcript_100230/m.309221 type:complete len:131 (+) Transcript_100230:81-473(+)
MPAAQAGDYVDAELAETLLRQSYTEILRHAAGMRATSLACPAIGCGIRTYPIREAARIGLGAILEDRLVPYVEVRIWDWVTFLSWRQECEALALTACEEADVQDALWDGEPLANWHSKQLSREKQYCAVM